MAENFQGHYSARPRSNPLGNADDIARTQGSFTDFPDAHATIKSPIGEGDLVVVRLNITGTHQDDFEDIGAPATDRMASWQIVITWRIGCGEFVETGW